jgi:hypothetical protein
MIGALEQTTDFGALVPRFINFEVGPSRKLRWNLHAEALPRPWRMPLQGDTRRESPAELAGLSRKSALAALAGLLAGLLRLLPWVLTGLLLTLLPRLVALPTLLRLALVVLVHVNLPKLPNYNLNAHHSN